ncbi:MAG: hypothetical protein HY909_00655 [Deltaproteobacteria bacterium]|nr:hypothetical protein [Deltaproteobacteria bacterium]
MKRHGVMVLGLLSCTRVQAQPTPGAPPPTAVAPAPVATALSRFPEFPAAPSGAVGEGFRARWGDGRAELTSYDAVVPRYGERRSAELVLIYVTEPLDRATWVKDDDAPPERRVEALKLNQSLKFTTGLYPYSVLTSVFAPVDRWRSEAFAPVKLTLTAQEWCGHVFQGVWPGAERFNTQWFSYFAGEGEGSATVTVRPGGLYEDALLIQLRELDGPFNGGRDWAGELVPTLWRSRRTHQPYRPAPATISRTRGEASGSPVHRFVVVSGDYRRELTVEADGDHRVLGWSTSDGEVVSLRRTARLPYWQLNHESDAPARATLGLDLGPPAPDAPPGPGARVGF